MRILVTGGAGFLGSNLIASLLDLGNEVLCVDNFYTGTRENISPFLNNKKFEVLRHDVTMPLFVEVDQIYHLACPASPVHYQKFPVQTTKTSVLGSINMLGLAKRLNIPILLSSTSEIYGDPKETPQAESYWGNVNPIGIRACYDEGKRAAETLFYDYYRQFNVKIKIARIFNTYGPGMSLDDGRVVSNFIVQALKNEPLTVNGSGNQTRSFCYVKDLIEGLIALMNSETSILGPINLGNNDEITVVEFANKIIQACSSKSKLIFNPLPEDDPKIRKPDISKALKELNWKPKIDLDSGLKLSIEYFKKQINF